MSPTLVYGPAPTGVRMRAFPGFGDFLFVRHLSRLGEAAFLCGVRGGGRFAGIPDRDLVAYGRPARVIPSRRSRSTTSPRSDLRSGRRGLRGLLRPQPPSPADRPGPCGERPDRGRFRSTDGYQPQIMFLMVFPGKGDHRREFVVGRHR